MGQQSGTSLSAAACLGALLVLLLASPLTLGQDDEETRARNQLAKLQQDMGVLSKELKEDLVERSTLRAALRQSEVAIGRIRRDINATKKRLQRARSQLTDLRAQRQELLVARGEQQELIGREIQTAYQMGKQGQLQVLLNQEDPATLARAMAYYDYFYQARQEHIERYLGIIERINLLEPEITSTAEDLEDARQTLGRQERGLVASKAQRQGDLEQLSASIKNKDEQLQKMGRDSEELERLLTVIEQAIVGMEVPKQYQEFAGFRGQMPWPVTGKASNRFGGRRAGGKLRWQGLVIPATEGSNVSAIHHGRVVFADWFRGSGLLLIIDHGDGYMSLYSHNQSLLRDVGEWVSAGSAIATVGNSGGRQQSALYFEIRKDGKPTNPGPWLAGG
ncbi:MAG: peptidoglycan DD-metalloendopeptidase family protein [Halieaceae bacterium]